MQLFILRVLYICVPSNFFCANFRFLFLFTVRPSPGLLPLILVNRRLLSLAIPLDMTLLQEIASARAATIVCGLWRMSSGIFGLIPAVFSFLVPERSQSVLGLMPGHSRRESWWMEQPDLHTLLSKFGSCEATDVRDKVSKQVTCSSD